jgi:hypothetical protein
MPFDSYNYVVALYSDDLGMAIQLAISLPVYLPLSSPLSLDIVVYIPSKCTVLTPNTLRPERARGKMPLNGKD